MGDQFSGRPALTGQEDLHVGDELRVGKPGQGAESVVLHVIL
jgi:hypothetical protein